MSEPVPCFFAYSDQPPSVAESMDHAIGEMRANYSALVQVRSWRDLSVTGKLLLGEICRAIDNCDLFVCDLTTLSRNVLFELGYAISVNKKVWISLNSTIPDAIRNYKKVSPLSTIGCVRYQNSFELVERFFSEKPYEDLDATLFKSLLTSLVYAQSRPPTLLYLMSELKTEASVRLTRRLRNCLIPITVDDPEEVASHQLMWYMEQMSHACGVIVHFVSEGNEPSSLLLQNAKYSLVSGIAYGFDLPLLMLAHSPFSSPVDYRDLLEVHETAKACLVKVDDWLPQAQEVYLRDLQRQRHRMDEFKVAAGLQRIHLGELQAENERYDLQSYFVETAAYREALSTPPYRIFVGRKGTGKTANLYQIERTLMQDKRNYVCVIKPTDYELEGVLSLLTATLPKAHPGYLIESLWKFLIYTELALSVYHQISQDPPHVHHAPAETALLEYLENAPLVREPFTVRMEHAIEDLCLIDTRQSVRNQREKVSEILHRELLGDLRKLLGSALHEKHRVVILVDNLDKAWKRREDLDVLATFVFGLLGAGRRISEEFGRDRVRWPGMNISLIIFLRSDIFAYVRSVARESDKIAFTRMDWNDQRLLERIIEKRFARSLGETLGETISSSDIWDRFFVQTVKRMPTREYIVSRVIPRPRDIISFCRSALSHAINHGHIKIEEEDISQAEEDYSEYAVYTLLAEIDAQVNNAENLLLEFAGSRSTITRSQIREILGRVSIDEAELDQVIDLLYQSAFLGLETQPGRFDFLYETSRKEVFQTLARKTAAQTGEQRYRINIPFHSFLEIADSWA